MLPPRYLYEKPKPKDEDIYVDSGPSIVKIQDSWFTRFISPGRRSSISIRTSGMVEHYPYYDYPTGVYNYTTIGIFIVIIIIIGISFWHWNKRNNMNNSNLDVSRASSTLIELEQISCFIKNDNGLEI